MVDVEHFREGKGLQLAPVTDKSPLEVAHTALAEIHAAVERVDGVGCQAIDAAADIGAALAVVVVKSGDAHRPISAYIERLLVVDVVGDAHQSVATLLEVSLELPDVFAELFLAEDRVNRRQHERLAGEHRTQLKEGVHTAWRTFHLQPQGNDVPFQAIVDDLTQMLLHGGHLLVADHADLLRAVLHKDAQQTVDEALAVDAYQRLRVFDALGCQS